MDFLNQLKKEKKILKVLIIGSGGVGKTSLLKVLKSGKLLENVNESYHRTLFMEIETLRLGEQDSEFNMMFMDLAGQTDLPMHALTDFQRLSLGSTDLVILMFANNNLQSLIDLQQWYGLLYAYHESKNTALPSIILVQNKCDLTKAFDQSIVDSMKSAVGEIIGHHEISLVSGEGLDDLRLELEGLQKMFG